MKIFPASPIWGQTLMPGYCGFITREHDVVGDGIEYFERFETGLPFVHTFIIERERESSSNGGASIPASRVTIIEAHAATGVARSTLDEYLSNDGRTARCQCFIRIPLGYTEEIGQKIVDEARRHIGEKYGFGTIVADALANTWFGHGLDLLTRHRWDRLICFLLTDRHQKICSQLVALALQSRLYLRLRGCLRRPADTILPKELGNDPAIWDPCIYKIK